MICITVQRLETSPLRPEGSSEDRQPLISKCSAALGFSENEIYKQRIEH